MSILPTAKIEFEYDEKINEIGAAIGEGDRMPTARTFTVHRADGGHSVIPATSPLYEPFYYTLLFPTGTLGWGIGMLIFFFLKKSSFIFPL